MMNPLKVSGMDALFGSDDEKFLPSYESIPAEFKNCKHPWAKWQQEWFFKGLLRYPVAKNGIDLHAALAHLAVIQRSWVSAEHKQAAMTYLASCWFDGPDGEEIPGAKESRARKEAERIENERKEEQKRQEILKKREEDYAWLIHKREDDPRERLIQQGRIRVRNDR